MNQLPPSIMKGPSNRGLGTPKYSHNKVFCYKLFIVRPFYNKIKNNDVDHSIDGDSDNSDHDDSHPARIFF